MNTNLTALLLTIISTNWFMDTTAGEFIALRAETKLLVVEYAGKKYTNEVDKFYTGLIEVKEIETITFPDGPTNVVIPWFNYVTTNYISTNVIFPIITTNFDMPFVYPVDRGLPH